ncbi:hypothetical protein POTOM_050113 [Populus tomentosa]|uniref:Uncharacterized protein n=1 Tax=Populus tomentosa TaxID=118781 RepID=A0A8X7YHY3_POPTO|nr:hypothetical protein POTOM_050113 [Populus tomentosa]
MSIALNIEGPSHSPSHSPSQSTSCSTDHHAWLQSLMTESRAGNPNQVDKLEVSRVPSEFRQMKENTDCYEPLVVSIGPYHHGKKELKEMEKLKAKMAGQFVEGSRVAAEEMYSKVKELVSDARKCYAEESTCQFNDEKFTQMMFLDGYFILQVVSDKLAKQNLRKEEVASVRRDLFLLENQLPFKVLIPLMRLLVTKLPKALNLSSKSPISMDTTFGLDSYNHLLEVFYFMFVYGGPEGQHQPERRMYREIPRWNRYYSVNELKNVGISFKPSNTSVFTDVKFKKTLLGGALRIPPLIIEDSTKSLLLNLAVYETCAQWYYGRCTSYLCLMRSLIDKPEDVMELRSKGILRTTIGSDDQIAQIFKEITTNLVPNPTAYTEVKRSVESHYRSNFNRLILQNKDPISKAVVKYSFIYGMAVTAIQAYLAETKEKPGFGNCSCSNATLQHP